MVSVLFLDLIELHGIGVPVYTKLRCSKTVLSPVAVAALTIGERGSVLYLGMAAEILNLP